MLQICADCTCRYSIGAPKCPHCGSLLYRLQGEEDGPIRSTETGEPVQTEPELAPATATKTTRRAGGAAT